MLIKILEKENNRRGDLFGRLMADLFVALGYEQPRLNIHKSGRELDLSTEHRLEPRRAIAECKCTTEPIGGDALNKLVGVLDVEHSDSSAVTGYFISLSGFTETACEQERNRRTKIVMLTGSQVVSHLITGRILISKDRATEIAGRCCAKHPHLNLDDQAELLAHQRGWVWAIYYTHGAARMAFVLIHSDGTPLARTIAEEVIAADRNCGGTLDKLQCINPAPEPDSASKESLREALSAYRDYVDRECGFIYLDGMPADGEVTRRLKLENLFVPLHVTVKRVDDATKLARIPLGVALANHPRLALLSAPGGGKSTLIKRLAVAYADPERRKHVEDDLPEQDCLPLFFRCRELRELSRASFSELLDALSQKEGVRDHATVFRTHAERALLSGKAMLLIDGLDEISDPGDRAAFVCMLRATLQALPHTALVVTSREAGFRHVAAHLAPICPQATLEALDDADIRRLCIAWHSEVVGDSEKVRQDAADLAESIIGNDRIQRLATNPLLLTTLLLVKRWVGSLPTRRAALYGKAVELLLMTWNTEAYTPIPEEEALPQLCFVASAMMLDGVQKISRPRLARLLEDARAALQVELGYVKQSVHEFIERVEFRSSLLMMTGLDVEDGRLVEFYEFRHLTFQEFLTARAFVEGWYRDRSSEDTLASLLAPHFSDPKWQEVIPLAAVLGRNATDGLLKELTEVVSGSRELQIGSVLSGCLADEAPARPLTIQAAVRALIPSGGTDRMLELACRGRYGPAFREESGAVFMNTPGNSAALILHYSVWPHVLKHDVSDAQAVAVRELYEMLHSTSTLTRCEGVFGLARAVHLPRALESVREIPDLDVTLHSMLSASAAEAFASAWALYDFGEIGWRPPYIPDILGGLFHLSTRSDHPASELAALAIVSFPLASREEGRCQSVLQSLAAEQYQALQRAAALIVAWYTKARSDFVLREELSRLKIPQATFRGLRDLELILNPRDDAPSH